MKMKSRIFTVCVLVVLLNVILEWTGKLRDIWITYTKDNVLSITAGSKTSVSNIKPEETMTARHAPKTAVWKTIANRFSMNHVNYESKPIYLNELFPNETYPPFQPNVSADFPTRDGNPRIPHIIHQTFSTIMIPAEFSYYAKKLVEKNPSWKYYFWTDGSARKLIKDRYYDLLKVWDNYNHSISRGDFLRYVVLHEYGGAYIDLDVDTLRPLDRVTMKYACIIPTEPIEHNVFLYKSQIFMNNAIMFCRPRHPFFKQMLDNIKDTAKYLDIVHGTGPGFVTRNFIKYNNIDVKDENRTKTDFESNSPYFYRGALPETHNDAVYVPNTQYFTDEIDLNLQKMRIIRMCYTLNQQSYLTRRACKDVVRRGLVRKDKGYKFLTHTWRHFWSNSSNYRERFNISIKNIIPKCIIFGETCYITRS